jgi:hypothetical protein
LAPKEAGAVGRERNPEWIVLDLTQDFYRGWNKFNAREEFFFI